MNKILLVFAVMCAMEQLAPVSSAPTNQNIDALKAAATYAVVSLNQSISILELTHMDFNTLKDDVTSFSQLLPVIKDIAANETDEITLNYYEEIIDETNSSIVALNNLIAALEDHDEEEDGESTTDNGECTTQVQPTDPSVTNLKSQSETDQCRQLGKATIISALMGQAILTYQAILQV